MLLESTCTGVAKSAGFCRYINSLYHIDGPYVNVGQIVYLYATPALRPPCEGWHLNICCLFNVPDIATILCSLVLPFCLLRNGSFTDFRATKLKENCKLWKTLETDILTVFSVHNRGNVVILFDTPVAMDNGIHKGPRLKTQTFVTSARKLRISVERVTNVFVQKVIETVMLQRWNLFGISVECVFVNFIGIVSLRTFSSRSSTESNLKRAVNQYGIRINSKLGVHYRIRSILQQLSLVKKYVLKSGELIFVCAIRGWDDGPLALKIIVFSTHSGRLIEATTVDCRTSLF